LVVGFRTLKAAPAKLVLWRLRRGYGGFVGV